MSADGFPNKPKILKGAFVEYGLSLPPLFVVFQFNPEQLSRSRSMNFSAPNADEETTEDIEETEDDEGRRTTRRRPGPSNDLRRLHQGCAVAEGDNLLNIRSAQRVSYENESINFDIRLDATDDMSDGDAVASRLGILPRLSTLELMMHPKSDSLLGNLADLLGDDGGFTFAGEEKPPMVLFMWGHTRVLPVNINSMSISETEFNRYLSPTRATVSVGMTVIESDNLPYQYSKVLKETSSALNLANIGDIANVVVPG